ARRLLLRPVPRRARRDVRHRHHPHVRRPAAGFTGRCRQHAASGVSQAGASALARRISERERHGASPAGAPAVTRRVLFATASLIAAGAVTASSFSVFASRWPNGNVTLQLQLGTSAALSNGARTWGEVAEAALADWNRTIQSLQLQVVRDSTSAKGDGNSINNVFFSSDIYGMDFEANVLAVTTTWRRGS